MKLFKALVSLEMARSNAEAQRLVKQGSVWVGGCIAPCNARKFPFKCTCSGWRKVVNPTEEIKIHEVIRIKDGSFRLMTRDDGVAGFDSLRGIGRLLLDIRTEVVVDDKIGRIVERDNDRYTISVNDETWQNCDIIQFLVIRKNNDVIK